MLFQKINAALKEAMKAGDGFKVGVLRMTLAAVHNKEIEKRGNLSEDDVLEVLIKEEKKRREAAEAFLKGGRSELAEKELKEAEMIRAYLPEPASESEIALAVEKIISETGTVSEKDFGKVMGKAVKDFKGRADAALLSKIIKEKLAG